MISVKCPNILIHAGQSPPGQGPVSVRTQNFYDALAMDRAQGVHPHVGVFEETTATHIAVLPYISLVTNRLRLSTCTE